jgi:hypothetical protein
MRQTQLMNDVKDLYMNDFFNEKAEKKVEQLTLDQAKRKHPMLFAEPKRPIAFKNPELEPLAKLKPKAPKDEFESDKIVITKVDMSPRPPRDNLVLPRFKKQEILQI